MSVNFLSHMENAFLRWLISSPRVGLIAIKQFGTDEVCVLRTAMIRLLTSQA
jgi:hypothetical protein